MLSPSAACCMAMKVPHLLELSCVCCYVWVRHAQLQLLIRPLCCCQFVDHVTFQSTADMPAPAVYMLLLRVLLLLAMVPKRAAAAEPAA